MLTGKVVDQFEVDGKEVKIRYPQMTDLDDLLEFVNSIVDEGDVKVSHQEKKSKEEEAEWLTGLLEDVEKGEKIALVAEVDGKVLGSTRIDQESSIRSHVGEFGIMLAKEIRGMGIGTKIAEAVIEEAEERLDIETVTLHVFSNNDEAYNFYKKLGFREAGEIPGGIIWKGNSVDDILMYKKV